MRELLSVARGLKHSYSLSSKQIQYVSSHQSPCRLPNAVKKVQESLRRFRKFSKGL